jgi:hypothetical protein
VGCPDNTWHRHLDLPGLFRRVLTLIWHLLAGLKQLKLLVLKLIYYFLGNLKFKDGIVLSDWSFLCCVLNGLNVK